MHSFTLLQCPHQLVCIFGGAGLLQMSCFSYTLRYLVRRSHDRNRKGILDFRCPKRTETRKKNTVPKTDRAQPFLVLLTTGTRESSVLRVFWSFPRTPPYLPTGT